ncbi:hypothetical protein PC129_g19215 [Phytophthora cactorum]|uniref:Uncharacterized protein n=1 Tax=Phytophthora cactorum TaxID=29920 RepID=A0A8T0ZGL3_9STRA|nr:hypothetical protein PC111_g19673 [Phytophthora cactorum]KAG2861053.1 hypothetical protein PC113_g7499 [Phytophthora cactorum]KAG2879978.1 hypothetical protein PC114_g22288 [Phytophthora cactorum]KAG2889154.1 hypothetical protein PC115_g19827 [Phytophthora cactorum]KAG2899953.1 hypothetical protein PC117_g22097 [Phytophthora cactorum]
MNDSQRRVKADKNPKWIHDAGAAAARRLVERGSMTPDHRYLMHGIEFAGVVRAIPAQGRTYHCTAPLLLPLLARA